MAESGVYYIKCVTDNGEYIYVGETINFHKRFLEHKNYFKRQEHHNTILQHIYNKYGFFVFEFNVLELCKPSKTKLLEKEWYDTFVECGKNLVNLVIPDGKGHGVNILQDTKPVYQYTTEGKFVACYSSGMVAAEVNSTTNTHSNIYRACSGELMSYLGYIWSNSDDGDVIKEKINKLIDNQNSLLCGVDKIDIETFEVLKTYKSITDAYRNTGVSKGDICAVINSRQITAGGFAWVRSGEKLLKQYKRKIINGSRGNSKVVDVIDIDTGKKLRFKSVKEAKEELSLNKGCGKIGIVHNGKYLILFGDYSMDDINKAVEKYRNSSIGKAKKVIMYDATDMLKHIVFRSTYEASKLTGYCSPSICKYLDTNIPYRNCLWYTVEI